MESDKNEAASDQALASIDEIAHASVNTYNDEGGILSDTMAEDAEILFDEMIPPPPPLPSSHSPLPATPSHSQTPPLQAASPDIFDVNSPIDNIRLTTKFIRALHDTTWDDIEPDIAKRLQNPEEGTPSVESPDHRFCIEVYLSTQSASQETYHNVTAAYRRRMEGLGHEPDVLSFHWVEKLVKDLTGVEEVYTDMCEDSCIAFDGMYKDLDACPMPNCGKPRYHNGKPKKQCITMPIGLQLQAMWRSQKSTESMRYRQECNRKMKQDLRDPGPDGNQLGIKKTPYCDIFDGSDYWAAVCDKRIKDNDVVLVMSFDGAQLYRNKASDTWIWIWILMDLPPSERYKKSSVLVGGMIPGPNKPKILESFFLKGFRHLAICQKFGLRA
jgi:hypothetical protein